jgi:hypothetical protein
MFASLFYIKSGSQYLTGWDEHSGRPFWTTDRALAKTFHRLPFALDIADGIGRVMFDHDGKEHRVTNRTIAELVS